MLVAILIGVAVVVVSTAISIVVQRYILSREMKNIFLTLSSQALRNNNEEFLALANQKMETEQQKLTGDMEVKRKEITLAVQELSKRLTDYETLVRGFEKDRDTKYGSIDQQMKTTFEATAKLQQTTERLSSILGNVKLRGQWGERMAEDILRHAGLQEHVHYVRNQSQQNGTRPDYTFLLPNGNKVNMDVKFPLDKYLRLRNSQNENEQKTLRDEFMRDVKNRIKEIQNKEYINEAAQTLNYVLLFIPNEQVFGFINNTDPQLMDSALKQKVILCSPFTLYAVISVVRQAHDNFYFSKSTQDILAAISDFSKTYQLFQDRFTELGPMLEKAQDKYDEIASTSYRMMQSKLRKVEQFRKGDAPEVPAGGVSREATPAVSERTTSVTEEDDEIVEYE